MQYEWEEWGSAPIIPRPIPHTTSAPVIDTQTSFLKLPSEIRNDIYTLLFEDCRPKHLTLLDISIDPLNGLEYPSFKLDEKVHGTGLLRTCRQIYHEAVPILYANNTFGFSDYKKGDDGAVAIQAWFKQIGTQVTRLQCIEFKLKFPHLAALPYLELFWHFRLTLNFEFVSIANGTVDDSNKFTNMNIMMRALVKDDIDIKKYGSQIWSVDIIWPREVHVKYEGKSKPAGEYLPTTSSTFTLDPATKTLVLKPQEPVPFLNLPPGILGSIFRYVIFPNGKDMVDRENTMALRLVSRRWHSRIKYHIQQDYIALYGDGD